MKTILLALALVISTACFADTPTPEQLAAAPVVDLLQMVNGGSGSVDGQIVKLKFGWRQGEDMLVAGNGKARGKGYRAAGKKVIVPDDARARMWFSSLPTKDNSPTTQTAYVKIHSNAASELIGRDVRNGQPVW